jgi:NADH:ubiquinone reductase (H+-translocating)
MHTADRKRILVVGGGYVGLYAAMRLMRRVDRREWVVTVIDPRSYMTYQPFLPEAAAGSVSPRHTVVPLRPVLKHAEVIAGRVTMIDNHRQTVRVEPIEGEPYDLAYEHIVVSAGSVPRVLPIPGLAEYGMGFKQIEEAIALRNYVIERLELAETAPDDAARARALTFVFVGGGYAGIEAIAELEDMARYACRYYQHVTVKDLRFVLVEAADRILPEVGPELGEYALIQLLERRIDVRLKTFLESYDNRRVILSDGDQFDADTLVWTAGVKANPIIATSDLPFDDRGRLICDTTLRVSGVLNAWGAGDCAAVPDLANPGQFCSPSAQHAVRQAPVLADNILAVIKGREPKSYKHKHVGSVASLGLHKGVANVYGIKLKGWPAWFMHRTYHVSRVPTLQRKVSIVAEWTLQLFFPRDVVGLGALHAPRAEFGRVSRPN